MRNLIPVYFIFALVWCIAHDCSAQRDTWDQANKPNPRQTVTKSKDKVKSRKQKIQQWGLDSNYNHAFSLGGRLNSNGWTGLVVYQRRINEAQAHFFQLGFSEIIHEKQIRQEKGSDAFPEFGKRAPFFFGKINNLYSLQLGHGRYFVLFPGVLEGNVSVGVRAQAGFSLAMLKPYYLKLIYTDYSSGSRETYLQEERYTDDNQEKFLKAGDIFGAAKWSKGLNQVTYIPGGYADIAFALEPVKHKTFVQAVTLGANIAFYAHPLPIMANRPAYPWQASLYAGVTFGKRWR